MDKIVLNGKRFIALGDFNELRRNLVKDIYDRYERGEDGQIHLSDLDMGRIDAYSHIMVEIMAEEMHEINTTATTPEELRAGYDKLHKDIRREWMRDKWLILSTDVEVEGEKSQTVYFRKFCDHFEEGKETPVFTNMRRLAKAFGDHYEAECVLERLKRETSDENLRLMSVDVAYMSKAQAKGLLDAIFGEDGDAE